jgi:hypothetical protein
LSPLSVSVKDQWVSPCEKCWTYWSHAEDMWLVNRCSMFINKCLTKAHCFKGLCWERNWGGPHGPLSRAERCIQEPCIRPTLLDQRERLSRTWTACGKRTSGICGLAQEAYVSCVSEFSYRMYINLNCRNSCIWVTTCFVAVSMKIIEWN